VLVSSQGTQLFEAENAEELTCDVIAKGHKHSV